MSSFITLSEIERFIGEQIIPECVSVTGGTFDIISAVALQLSKPTKVGDNAILSLPVMYPGGTHAIVYISGENGSFIVSDDGVGYREAEKAGVTRGYVVNARKIAEENSLSFDDKAFYAYATRRTLCGVVANVANASTKAVYKSVDNLSVNIDDVTRMIFRNKLIEAFGKESVAEGAPIRGGSGEQYEADFFVEVNGRAAVFQSVSPHHSSIGSAVVFFQDLALLRNAPTRVAAVHKKEKFGPKLMVVSAVANIVDIDTSSQGFSGALEHVS